MSDNKKQMPKGSKNSKNNFNFYWIYGIIALLVIIFQISTYNSGDSKKILWGELSEMLAKKHVSKIKVINKDEFAEIYIKESAISDYPELQKSTQGFNLSKTEPFFVYNGDLNDFGQRVLDFQESKNIEVSDRVYISNETRTDYTYQIFSWLLPIGLIILFWVFIMKRMSGGAGGGGGQIFNIGKSKAQLFDQNNNVKVNFNDVAGLEEAKIEVMEIVDFLKNPKKYSALGGKIPKGALLVGLPGTGKTLLAKAVAGEAKVPFFSLSGSDFVEMFVGVGASRVRDLFKQAKEKAPCIVFIDEIDAIGRARGKNNITGGNDERENTLNQLLTEMDGFSGNQGVIILAATNRADVLDRALMRAGRFDRQIHVELPDLNEREKIFDVHLKPIKIGPDVDSKHLSKQTPGFSGADIANVCNEAALIAARRNSKDVVQKDFNNAVDRIIGGLEKKNKLITPHEKSVIAHHEAGHAAVSWLLEHANPLVKVSIIPRGKSLGAAWYLPEERQITNFDQMFDEMTAALGGRAAEKLIFDKVSTGALNDLEKVTKQAYAIVSYFGLNDKVGNISFYDSSGQREYNFTKPYSEKTAETIDQEVRKMAEDAYKRALEILSKNKNKLVELANKLLEEEVIYSDDVKKIFGERPFVKEERVPAFTKNKKSLKDVEAEMSNNKDSESDDNDAEIDDSKSEKNDD